MTDDPKKETKETTWETPENEERAEVPSAQAELERKEEEIRSYIDRLKRLQAEFENYKKRALRGTAALEERISDREILDFLPLYDNLERAFRSYRGTNDAPSLIEGIERIFGQFDLVLKQKGVSPIDAIGGLFDPAQHEALLSVPSDEEENVILEEFERGYLRNGRALRPSKVKVSKGKVQPKEEKR